ncbi:MAG: glycerophosphodiester phosphodiesterase family protein [Chloroflexota bacterium]|nr:glycerophosphodiester phosphodiesterase family protein [Chloroflexota bacterium]
METSDESSAGAGGALPAGMGDGGSAAPMPDGGWRTSGGVLVLAHRANSAGVVENSLAGIRRSADAGADLVELDVRRSLDGVPFLLHDRTLQRTTTGFGPVRWEPSSYLRRVRLRGSDERLPTLEAALDALPAGVGPALHLKDQGSLLAALRVVQAAGIEARTWLWLHGTAAVRLARQRAPGIRVTLLEAGATTLPAWVAHLDGAKDAGAAGVSIPWPDLSPDLLHEIRSRDLVAFSLHHDLERIPAHVEHGLGGIISDAPETVRATLDDLGIAPAGAPGTVPLPG